MRAWVGAVAALALWGTTVAPASAVHSGTTKRTPSAVSGSSVGSGPGSASQRRAAPGSAAETELVAAYGFERYSAGLAVDSGPFGLDGMLVNYPNGPTKVPSVTGHGKALGFDGAQQQYVDVGDAPPLDVDHYSLMAWVRYAPRVHDQRWEVLEKAGAYWMNIRTDTRRLRIGGFFGACDSSVPGTWRYLDSSRTLSPWTWTHVAATYDGATLRLFINGWLDRSLAVSGTTCANDSRLAIGAKNKDGVVEAYFDGGIDDVQIYGRALTGAEIRSLRQAPVA